MEVSYRNRPYKISNGDRKFKGVVAANLTEIKEKSVTSLNIDGVPDEVDVFLAEDDTLIDNQEYFATVPENTRLIIKLKDGTDDVVIDHVDGPTEVSESQEFSCFTLPEEIRRKMGSVDSSHCIVSLLAMSNEELETISNMSIETLQNEMEVDEDIARVCIDSATKELVRRTELLDATQLLNMFQKAKERFDVTDGGKRKKTST